MYSQWQGPIRSIIRKGISTRKLIPENNRYNDHLLEGDFFVTQQPLKPFQG